MEGGRLLPKRSGTPSATNGLILFAGLNTLDMMALSPNLPAV